MATMRQAPPQPPPPVRVAELEVELRFEPTHFLYWDFGEPHPRSDPAWQSVLDEYCRLVCTHEGSPCESCRRRAEATFPDEWLHDTERDAALVRRDAVLAAGGSRAQAVAAMHPTDCTCRRHDSGGRKAGLECHSE